MDDRIAQLNKFAESNDLAGLKLVPIRLHFRRECYECHQLCMYWGGYFCNREMIEHGLSLRQWCSQIVISGMADGPNFDLTIIDDIFYLIRQLQPEGPEQLRDMPMIDGRDALLYASTADYYPGDIGADLRSACEKNNSRVYEYIMSFRFCADVTSKFYNIVSVAKPVMSEDIPLFTVLCANGDVNALKKIPKPPTPEHRKEYYEQHQTIMYFGGMNHNREMIKYGLTWAIRFAWWALVGMSSMPEFDQSIVDDLLYREMHVCELYFPQDIDAYVTGADAVPPDAMEMIREHAEESENPIYEYIVNFKFDKNNPCCGFYAFCGQRPSEVA
jgi:hypothetical protein